MLGVLLLIVGLEGKAYHHLTVFLHTSQLSSNIRIGDKVNIHCLPHPLDLLISHLRRTEVGNGSTQDGSIHLRKGIDRCLKHFLTTLHIDSLYAIGCGKTDGTGNKSNFGTAAGTFLSKGEAHLATTVVADKTHGVNLLVCRTGSNQEFLRMQSVECRVCYRSRVCPSISGGSKLYTLHSTLYTRKKRFEFSHNFLRLLHPSLALESAGQETALRLDDDITEALQTLHVLLRGGMGIHIEVHRRCNEHRSLHRQIGGDEHIVGNAVGHLPQRRSSTGSNQHGIGPETQCHMRVPRAVAL